MLSIEDSPLTHDGRVLVLAHDHGLEHGPGTFEGATADEAPDA